MAESGDELRHARDISSLSYFGALTLSAPTYLTRCVNSHNCSIPIKQNILASLTTGINLLCLSGFCFFLTSCVFVDEQVHQHRLGSRLSGLKKRKKKADI